MKLRLHKSAFDVRAARNSSRTRNSSRHARAREGRLSLAGHAHDPLARLRGGRGAQQVAHALCAIEAETDVCALKVRGVSTGGRNAPCS